MKVIAGVSGTLSGLLLAGLAYKVVGGYQDEIKEARREVSRQNQERKARLAQVRRLLSGPLRTAARFETSIGLHLKDAAEAKGRGTSEDSGELLLGALSR